jgi:hypothetical protein
MKKLMFVAALVLILSGNAYAQNSKKLEMYVAPTFGMGFAFNNHNSVGLSAGIDVVFKVWENNKKAPGKMFAGIDTGFQYWFPTISRSIYGWQRHYFTMPVTGYFSYEFKVNAGPLAYAGPFFAMGISFDIEHEENNDAVTKSKTTFYPDFASAFGGTLVFSNNWMVKQSFAWSTIGLGWSSFIIEAGYRF